MSRSRKALIQRLFEAFNRRDIEAILSALSEDVDWPDAIEGGRVRGREAVSRYWTEQFKLIRVEHTLTEIADTAEGNIRVRSLQLVRNLEGQLWSESPVNFTFAFDEAGLITRMDVG